MRLYSTNNKENIVELKRAILEPSPSDGGLYLPVEIPKLSHNFLRGLKDLEFNEIAFCITKHLFGGYLPLSDLEKVINSAFDFSPFLRKFDERLYGLELFHGPSLAFKDFGVRFLAQLMRYFIKDENRRISLLVATSGDTGSAVASGFHNVEGIDVIILYPANKISLEQKSQMLSWGNNINCIELNGSFDDCQSIIKKAMLDERLKQKYSFSTANSINIARLIAQTFYYFDGLKLFNPSQKLVVGVPSGNFGNLCSAYIAKMMGLNIDKLIAATNINSVVPDYIKTGNYKPMPSSPTISNAMDVGKPSNFIRLFTLTGSTWNLFKKDILGFVSNEHQTPEAIKRIWDHWSYICDPHGAISYASIEEILINNPKHKGVFLATAHPLKFKTTVESILNMDIESHFTIRTIQKLDKIPIKLDRSYNSFKEWLLKHY